MTTKEEEFKQRFVAVLKDLQNHGKDDIEAMWLLGSLASQIIEKAEQRSWTSFKSTLARTTYDGLLRDFQKEGNALHQQGKGKPAYAIQILGISLVAKTQMDEQLRAGEALLDEMIDYTVTVYRKNRHLQNRPN